MLRKYDVTIGLVWFVCFLRFLFFIFFYYDNIHMNVLQLCENMYQQEPGILKEQVLQLVGMAELGVDIAWQELDKDKSRPLPETHPLVRTERSVWEVRAAAKILLTSLEDLQLHKALVKRAKILVNSFSELSTLLVEGGAGEVLSSPQEVAAGASYKKILPTPCRISFHSIHNPDKSRTLTQALR